MPEPEAKKLYAIQNRVNKEYFSHWDNSIRKEVCAVTHYGQYCLEVAEKRIKNMLHPEEWEVVIAPHQGRWNHGVYRGRGE